MYPTIQTAIDDCVNGDTVLISPGTYFENIDFIGKAIKVKGAWGATLTKIDGQHLGPVVSFMNFEGNSSILEGLTITNGRGPDEIGFGKVAKAGGIYLLCAYPTIVDCVVINNRGGDAGATAIAGGGGLSCEGRGPGDGFIVKRSHFENNYGGSAIPDFAGEVNGQPGAGGIHCVEGVGHFISCIIKNNVGGAGAHSNITGGAGGIEFTLPHGTPTVYDCVVDSNHGGMAMENMLFAGAGGIHGASPEITQSEIRNNVGGNAAGVVGSMSGGAGGIFGKAPIIKNCIIENNEGGAADLESIRGGAGGVYVLGDAEIHTCRITGNIGGNDGAAPGIGSGGGIHALDGFVKVYSCTIADNIGGIGYDGSGSGGIHIDLGSVDVRNSIVWDNLAGGVGPLPSADEIGGSGAAAVVFSDVKGGFPGWGNVSMDPDFMNPAANDYHLKLSSMCIDHGDMMTAIPTLLDIDTEPRIVGIIDMGCDEANLHIYPGSNEDLVLETVVNFWGNPEASVRFAEAGDFVTMSVHSPLGTFAPGTMLLLGQGFPTGSPPAPVIGYPELRIQPGAYFLLAPGLAPAWEIPITNGFTWGFAVPVSYPGYSLMVQGFALSPLAANGYFATTEGHELRFN